MSALAAIHVAKKQLGLDEDTYRALLVRVTGQSSAGDMTERQREAVVAELRNRGFKPAAGGARKGLEGRYAKKLQALWLCAWNLGVVENRKDAALLAFVKRQTGIDHVRFLRHPADAAKAIEALKAWMAREAGVDWTVDRLMQAHQRTSGYKVGVAQWNIMIAKGLARGRFAEIAASRSGRNLVDMEEGDWIPVMNAFGECIRKGVSL